MSLFRERLITEALEKNPLLTYQKSIRLGVFNGVKISEKLFNATRKRWLKVDMPEAEPCNESFTEEDYRATIRFFEEHGEDTIARHVRVMISLDAIINDLRNLKEIESSRAID